MLIKKITIALGLLAAQLFGATSWAASSNVCEPSGYYVGFFNGVFNTPDEAQEGYERLQLLAGDEYNGERVKGGVFYNTSGKLSERPDVTRFEDVAEVFQQRSAELDGVLANRWEYFWELLAGSNTPLWNRLTGVVPAATAVREALAVDIQGKLLAALVSVRSNPPTTADYARHDTRIQGLVTEREKMLLVAHSQGNLFVNNAYATAKRLTGNADSVKVVHIAPASVLLNGDYTLADIDIVINRLLRQMPGSVPLSNISIPASLSDVSGHELVATYLDATRAARGQIKAQMLSALAALVTPDTNGVSGFFTVTLTWDGEGDVDLHTFQPDGGHIFYSALKGSTGYLDTDNTVAWGPEHFYASCKPEELQTGTYRIGINNYARATGRLATVQVASLKSGEIFTKTLGVGPVLGGSGNDSPIPVVNVNVSKDEQGRYNVVAVPL